MQKISPIAKIPLKQFLGGNGSYGKRFEHAKKLNLKFYRQISPEIKNGMVSPIIYRKILKSLLPENVNINIMHLPQSDIDSGARGCTIALGETINGFTIKLPYKKEFGKKNKTAMIPVNNMTTIMHENFHIFSEVSNPKHLARCKFKNIKDYEIYTNNLYGKTKGRFGIGKIINIMNHLKKMSIEDRINYLQTCRYRLYEEDYAFMEGAKYNTSKYNYIPFSFFAQISFLEMLLFINIQKARKKNKSQVNKFN